MKDDKLYLYTGHVDDEEARKGSVFAVSTDGITFENQ